MAKQILLGSLLVALLASGICNGQQSTDVPVDQPAIVVGDRWVFEGIDLVAKKTSYKVDQTVSKVTDRQLITWNYQMLPPSNPSAGETTFNVATQMIERGRLSSGAHQATLFPLEVGKIWSHAAEFPYTDRAGTVQMKNEFNAAVVGWEEIEVPAGKFRALRIEHTGKWLRPDGSRGNLAATYWYAPAAKRLVRELNTTYDSGGSIYSQFERRLVEVTLKSGQ